MSEDVSPPAASLHFRETGSAASDMPQAPVLQSLLAYWQSKCGPGDRLPGRRDLEPLELRGLLPNIYLIDVLPDRRFRIRLPAEAHVEVYGPGKFGRILDAIFPPAEIGSASRRETVCPHVTLPVGAGTSKQT